jgi:hypothetical protein
MKILRFILISSLFIFSLLACGDKLTDIVEPYNTKLVFDPMSLSFRNNEKELDCKVVFTNPFVRMDRKPFEVGVCWSDNNQNPTINDKIQSTKITYTDYYDGVGAYDNIFVLKNLEAGRKYYIDSYVKIKDSVYYGRNFQRKVSLFQVPSCESAIKSITFKKITKPDDPFFFELYALFYDNNRLHGVGRSGETYVYNENVKTWTYKNRIDPLLPYIGSFQELRLFSIKDESYCLFTSDNFSNGDYYGINKMWKYDGSKGFWDNLPAFNDKSASNLLYLFSTDSSAIMYNYERNRKGNNIIFWEYVPKSNNLKNLGILDQGDAYTLKDFIKNGNDYYFVLSSNLYPSEQIYKYDFENKKIIERTSGLHTANCLIDFTAEGRSLFSYKNNMYSFGTKNIKGGGNYDNDSQQIILNQLYKYDEASKSFRPTHKITDNVTLIYPKFYPFNNKLYCISKNTLYEVTLE